MKTLLPAPSPLETLLVRDMGKELDVLCSNYLWSTLILLFEHVI